MVANYKQILYYLKIFDRLHHVTKLIKLVAFTKFKKIEYYIKILSDSFVSLRCEYNPITISNSKLQTYLIVSITSDKGCCGVINTYLTTLLDAFINNLKKQKKKYIYI